MKNFNGNDNNDKVKLKYFAEKAKEEINLNIIFHKQKEIYQNYIKDIKTILFDKDNIKDNFRKLNIKLKENNEKFQKEYDKIKSLKYNIYYKDCTDELEMGRPLLNQLKADKFTLEYTLSQKDNIIKVLNCNMKNSLIFTLFRQPKRDTFLDLKEADATIKDIINQDQAYMIKNSKNYNALKEKSKIKKKKIEKLKDKIQKLREFIYLINFEKNKINQKSMSSVSSHIISSQINSNSNLKTSDRTFCTYDITPSKKTIENKGNINTNKFELSNSIGKKYEEDIDDKNNINYNITNKEDHIKKAIMNTIIPIHLSINPSLNYDTLKNDIEITSNKNEAHFNYIINNKALSAENRKTKKNKKKKNIKNDKIIQTFQNLEELFQTIDSDNEKEEVIIDEVIHSDDETTLEKKIIQKKNLYDTYIDDIEEKIPKINLDLIEFNKLKVYQEIDLYSLERRNYKNMSIEDNIEMTKKKIKKIKKKVNINSKKAEAMKNFIDDLKNKYILYKRIKTKSSAINSKVNYIANHEIIDLNKVEEEENEDDYGSDYLNENDEITE